ncbi:Transcriptional regulator [hydrothermal vent metagenome]|uniref:Transcriptional regulator n=1 Tax=hydrothermal vent metagenome TaxID=652676 RepID=A0A3B0RSQ8_9ZZZZ
MSIKAPSDRNKKQVLSLTAKIVSSYVRNNEIDSSTLPDLIRSVFASLQKMGDIAQLEQTPKNPAVAIKNSITDEYLICLEDGKKLKMLKRYIRTRYNLTPDEYRRKWGLPASYPMVAPAYSKRRSQFARDIGLGRGVGRKKK